MKNFLLSLLFIANGLMLSAQKLPDFGAKFEPYEVVAPVIKKEINDIQCDRNSVWVGTDKGLAYISETDNGIRPISNNNAQFHIKTVFRSADGEIWVGNHINLITNVSTGGFNHEFKNDKGANFKINTIHKSGGVVWIGGSNGEIQGLNLSDNTVEEVSSVYKGNVNSLYSENGQLRLVGRDNGLFYKDETEWKEFRSIALVSKIMEKNGRVWILGEDKNQNSIILQSTDMLNWDDFGMQCVAQNNMIFYDFDIDEMGRNLWIATNIGILQYNFKKKVCNLFSRGQYPEFNMRSVHHLSVQNDSTVWVANKSGKLCKMTIYPILPEKEIEEEPIEEEITMVDTKLEDELVEEIVEEVAESPTKVDPKTNPVVKTKEIPTKPKSGKAKKQKSLVNFDDIECNQTLELSELFFQPNTANFINGRNANNYLDILVAYLHNNPDASIELYGHTDFLSNNKEFLLELSQNRVERVANYLKEQGIKKQRINTVAYGGDKPIITDKLAKDRNQNRRVEVLILCP